MPEYLLILTATIAASLGRVRRWFTFRRTLGILALLALVLFFQSFVAAGVDVFFLFGLDLGLVMEVSALLIILSARDQVIAAAHMLRRGLLRLRPLSRFLWRGVRRAFRSRPATPRLPPPPDDAPAAWALA